MIPRLQDTIEKPLGIADYIAALEYCVDSVEVAAYAELAPAVIRHDDRFANAVKRRLEAIRIAAERRSRAA